MNCTSCGTEKDSPSKKLKFPFRRHSGRHKEKAVKDSVEPEDMELHENVTASGSEAVVQARGGVVQEGTHSEHAHVHEGIKDEVSLSDINYESENSGDVIEFEEIGETDDFVEEDETDEEKEVNSRGESENEGENEMGAIEEVTESREMPLRENPMFCLYDENDDTDRPCETENQDEELVDIHNEGIDKNGEECILEYEDKDTESKEPAMVSKTKGKAKVDIVCKQKDVFSVVDKTVPKEPVDSVVNDEVTIEVQDFIIPEDSPFSQHVNKQSLSKVLSDQGNLVGHDLVPGEEIIVQYLTKKDTKHLKLVLRPASWHISHGIRNVLWYKMCHFLHRADEGDIYSEYLTDLFPSGKLFQLISIFYSDLLGFKHLFNFLTYTFEI